MKKYFLPFVFILFLSLAALFLWYPRSAKAIVPVFCVPTCQTWDLALSGPLGTVAPGYHVIKEVGIGGVPTGFTSWDSIAWLLAREILHIFTQEMVSWIRTGQFGGGPLFTTDLVGELFNAADNAAGHFLAQYASEEWYNLLCAPFRPHIYLALGSGRVPYIERARCTVTDIVDNLEDFYTDFSNGGWAAWFSTIEPQNNPYGLYLLSLEEKEQREREVTFDIRHNFLAGQGFIGLKKCAEGALLPPLHPQNPTPTKEFCTKYVTVTPGKVVEDQLIEALGKDVQKLGVADEINEILVEVFSQLLSWIVSGGSGGGGLLEADLPEEPVDVVSSTCLGEEGRTDGCSCDFPDESTTQCLSNFCSEASICTTPPTELVECSDEIDNDFDGLVDFPVDLQCTSAEDTSEGEEDILPPQELTIVSISPLPSGVVGVEYAFFTFEAEGGTPFLPEASTFPYLWEAVDTGIAPLPAGLFLSQGGILSGTPAAAGTWTFTVKVTDSVASSTQSAFILTVTP